MLLLFGSFIAPFGAASAKLARAKALNSELDERRLSNSQ